jgi:multidrug resistance efflux pump
MSDEPRDPLMEAPTESRPIPDVPPPLPRKMEPTPTPEPKKADPARAITTVLLVLLGMSLLWYLVADRATPSTSHARVSGLVIPIVPEVSGIVTSVNVALNQRVSAGDPLVQIESDSYGLAVEKAEAEVEQAGQSVGADTGGVASAQAAVAEARTHLEYVRHDGELTFNLQKQGIASQRRADRAQAKIEEAEARFAKAGAELERAKSQMGQAGSENPRLRSAVAALEQARIDLASSTVRAPADGGVTDVRLGPGQYASPGTPLLTFIATGDVWIEAQLRENSIGNIEPGQPVEIALDVAPGRVFEGVVHSVGFGVQWRQSDASGQLPKLAAPRDWLREPQRFPVIVKFADDSARGLRREGGQADLIIYTGDSSVLNALGAAWIRMMSLFSYVY